jgi:dienelactone hydrolase
MCRVLCVLIVAAGLNQPSRAEPLPNTKPLTRDGDLAAQMVEGIDKYLMREIEASVAKRKEYWKPDFSSVDAYTKSIEPNRLRLRKMLGVVDERVPFSDLVYVGGPNTPSLVAEAELFNVYAVRWPVLPGVDGEGLLLEPKGKVLANVIAIPDADWTPEMIAGLAPGPKGSQLVDTKGRSLADEEGLVQKVWDRSQFARRLAELGCRVLVPTLIDRADTWSGNPQLGRMTNQPHREFIYRQAYQMGRHIVGYEVQKVLAAVDWLCQKKNHPPIGVYGYGEGGMIALFAGALDERIRAVVVSGYFRAREGVWREPIYRNMWGQLTEAGDAELAARYFFRIAPGNTERERRLLVDGGNIRPLVTGPPTPRSGRSGAAPGRVPLPALDEEIAELKRAPGLWPKNSPYMEPFGDFEDGIIGEPTQVEFIRFLCGVDTNPPKADGKLLTDLRKDFDPADRQHRQFDQLVAFTQKLMRDSEAERAKTFWAKLDTSSLDKYAASTEPFRKQLWEEVLGKLPKPTLPMNAQSRQIYDEPKWTGHEVTLDLYPDVFAYGILLLPKDLKPGEKRPVVVCQHGLEGRPTDVCNPKMKTKYYNSFGAQLADKGYIVYAPQNPYIGQDKFRVLQRKANPLGLSLFSFIIAQHDRTLDFLQSLPNVDGDKIAFYGLSYGGKTAMRVPAVLPRYCLSICSGDFNEWTWKNVSVDFRGSYMFSGEYEMPEFNLGQTMVYAEMAALIAPRPFMVERGHDDGVGIDEYIGYEYAKVRRLYSRLKIPDRTEIEWFAGGHEIHGEGTFRFLQKHLGYPK